jgi:type II secretory pathway pseudopilin PulG
MLSLRRESTRPLFARRGKLMQAGFTIVEVVAAVGILGLMAGSVLFGLSQLNNYATVNRLYTAAQVLAQNQIDLILTMGPYDPAQDKYPVPLTCGDATATNTILRTDTPYYYNPAIASTNCPISTVEKQVTLYQDPMAPSGSATVLCTIRTQVVDTGATVPVNGVASSLDLRRATVTVAYTYRNQPYSVVMETMRTTDQ